MRLKNDVRPGANAFPLILMALTEAYNVRGAPLVIEEMTDEWVSAGVLDARRELYFDPLEVVVDLKNRLNKHFEVSYGDYPSPQIRVSPL